MLRRLILFLGAVAIGMMAVPMAVAAAPRSHRTECAQADCCTDCGMPSLQSCADRCAATLPDAAVPIRPNATSLPAESIVVAQLTAFRIVLDPPPPRSA